MDISRLQTRIKALAKEVHDNRTDNQDTVAGVWTQALSPQSQATAARAAELIKNVALQARALSGDDAPAPPSPPPAPPDPRQVLEQARLKASKIATITAGLQTWKEATIMYREARRGQPITGMKVWKAVRRVSKRSTLAANATWRRHMMVVGIDTAARIVAWKTADKAATSLIARALYGVSRRLAGRAGIALTAVEVFTSMHRDLKRHREGKLTQEDLVRNYALTGVCLAAPIAGAALAGPPGATVGLVVSLGAGMFKR